MLIPRHSSSWLAVYAQLMPPISPIVFTFITVHLKNSGRKNPGHRGFFLRGNRSRHPLSPNDTNAQ